MTNDLWMKDRVSSVEQLRMKIEEPREAIIKKTVDVVDEHIKQYLQMSSLFFLGSSNENSQMDVSPRGGKPGFVKVLDHKHIAFPDRTGKKDELPNTTDMYRAHLLLNGITL